MVHFPNYLLNQSTKAPQPKTVDTQSVPVPLAQQTKPIEMVKDVVVQPDLPPLKVNRPFKHAAVPSILQGIERSVKTVDYTQVIAQLHVADEDMLLFEATTRQVYQQLQELADMTETLEQVSSHLETPAYQKQDKTVKTFEPKHILPSLQSPAYAKNGDKTVRELAKEINQHNGSRFRPKDILPSSLIVQQQEHQQTEAVPVTPVTQQVDSEVVIEPVVAQQTSQHVDLDTYHLTKKKSKKVMKRSLNRSMASIMSQEHLVAHKMYQDKEKENG